MTAAYCLTADYATANTFFLFDAPYITIQADGAIQPQTDQISRSGNTYTLNANLTKTAVKILCSDLLFDGAGCNIAGGSGKTRNDASSNEGLRLQNVTNVTVKNVSVVLFSQGIYMEGCLNCSLLRVSVDELFLIDCQRGLITHSNISFGVATVRNSNGNLIYNNNIFWGGAFVNSRNFWDNGSVGNYWRDYNGTDTDGDGIGDTPYVIPSRWEPNDIDTEIDHYPSMKPIATQETPPLSGHQLELTPALLAEVSVAVISAVAVCVGFAVYFKKFHAPKRQTA